MKRPLVATLLLPTGTVSAFGRPGATDMPPLPARSSLPFDDALATSVLPVPKATDDARGTAPDGGGDTPREPLPATYDAAIAELERLVMAMEAGKLPLEQLLVNYRRGADLLEFCRARLESVEQQVQVLDEGRLKPWAGA